MTPVALMLLQLIDANEQAQRAADAGWETAKWTFWLVLATFLLVAGAAAAAVYAKQTWETAQGQLRAAEAERDNSNAQLKLAQQADREREATNVSAWLRVHRPYIFVYVRNGNGGPVYDVRCKVSAKPDGALPEPSLDVCTWDQMALAPAAAAVDNDLRAQVHEDSVVYEYTRDGIRRTRSGSDRIGLAKTADFKSWDGDPKSVGLAVELTFRDSSGRGWHRAWNGYLTQIDVHGRSLETGR
ncbi:hypothetical protein [Pseudarthrobacter sp. 1C304]|uniref:hypothetical protein n=1 Tax=Pseudarthrobacter sp. 1C304 TaxID=3457438 RepID=UPI003FCFF967